MTNPNASFMMETALRNCLQTLLYVSWLLKSKQNKVIITGGRKVDVRHNSNVIYWSVCNKSADFLSGFSMSELIIPAKHNIIVRFILYRLIQKPNCTPKLNDGVSLIHLIIIVGHMYEKVDESIDLINRYVANNPERVDFICPWTRKSTLDLALEREPCYPARMLHTMGCRALKCSEFARGSSVIWQQRTNKRKLARLEDSTDDYSVYHFRTTNLFYTSILYLTLQNQHMCF